MKSHSGCWRGFYDYVEMEGDGAMKRKFIMDRPEQPMYSKSAYVMDADSKLTGWNKDNNMLRSIRPVKEVRDLVEQFESRGLDSIICIHISDRTLVRDIKNVRFDAEDESINRAGLYVATDTVHVLNMLRIEFGCGTCGSFVAHGNGAEGLLKGSSQLKCQFCAQNDNEAGNAASRTLNDPASYPKLYVDTIEPEHPQSVNAMRSAQWGRTATAAVRIAAAESVLRFALLPTEMMSVARASNRTAKEKERFFLNPPSSVVNGTANLNGTYAELQRVSTDVFIASRAHSAFAGDQKTTAESELNNEAQIKTRVVWLPSEAESRRLNVALFVAFELIKDMAGSESSRILSLITGPRKLPEQAMPPVVSTVKGEIPEQSSTDETETKVALTKLYEQVGSKSGDVRLALDFLCSAVPERFAADILLGAAKRSREGLVYSATHSFSAASAVAEAAVNLFLRSASPHVVFIRVSSPLNVARLNGSAFSPASPQTNVVPGIDSMSEYSAILKPNST
ncbi:hypothetical protein FGB62_67g05 [Gracilaria domingensis]|nr:hypothetical protein FGB62_67g05 [Gracilaria domingensis]